MIDAYYSIGSDSRELFSPFEIAKKPDFEEHLNKYNVIHIDVSSAADFHREGLVESILDRLYMELKSEVQGEIDYCQSVNYVLSDVYHVTGRQFVIIIDEWDCVVRNQSDRQDLVHKYLQFLHAIFKSEESQSYLALAYITGILPIKITMNESGLNNFREYTMIDSKWLTKYFGFTLDEVKALCEKYEMDFDSVEKWCGGYLIDGMPMYNPNSVCEAMLRHELNPYWVDATSLETIKKIVMLDKEGLKDSVLKMLEGGRAPVDTNTFLNDLSVIRCRDDALTALIHLGYLSFDDEWNQAFIPNYEAKMALQAAIESVEM